MQQLQDQKQLQKQTNSNGSSSQQPVKKKRNLPGTPDPTAEVIALSPTTLMATNRFVCEICNKGFQRDQNLQLHRRGHNLPWKLRQRTSTEIKKRVYICPEPTCIHHNPSRALGDLTGIKKHFSRKHGEKKWKCDKCSKKYAVQSDWKAHLKTCGTREYKCDCGTIFSRRDSFITHRAFCDALAEENNKVNQGLSSSTLQTQTTSEFIPSIPPNNSIDMSSEFKSLPHDLIPMPFKSINMFSTSSGTLFGAHKSISSSSSSSLQLSSNTSSSGLNNGPQITGSAHMSATALLQKAAQMGATASNNTINSPMMQKSFGSSSMAGPTYGAMQYHHDPYEQTGVVASNCEGFSAKSPQEIAQFFEGGSTMMNDVGMLSGLFMGGGEQEDNSSSSDLIQGRTGQVRSPIGPSRFGVNGDTMTVDFLGIGGSRLPNLNEQLQQQQQQQQQQQRLDLEAISQQRLQAYPFQQISQRESAMEKSMWDA